MKWNGEVPVDLDFGWPEVAPIGNGFRSRSNRPPSVKMRFICWSRKKAMHKPSRAKLQKLDGLWRKETVGAVCSSVVQDLVWNVNTFGVNENWSSKRTNRCRSRSGRRKKEEEGACGGRTLVWCDIETKKSGGKWKSICGLDIVAIMVSIEVKPRKRCPNGHDKQKSTMQRTGLTHVQEASGQLCKWRWKAIETPNSSNLTECFCAQSGR